MPEILYNSTNFPPEYGAALDGENILAVSWAELVWAAISVGRAELMHITRHGRFSNFEIAYRTSILFANLCENQDGRLIRSSAYEGLDPSEKGAISYFLGLTLAKAFSGRILNVPWLMHLDVYREELQVILNVGESRPDLVGKNTNGEWVVMEAKGRTNKFDRRALDLAKEQACQVVEISGEIPVLHAGIQVHFGNGILQLEVDDPKPSEKKRLRLRLSKEKFEAGYYRPFKEWLSNGQVKEISNIRYLQKQISEFDITVGIAETIIESVRNYPPFDGSQEFNREGSTYSAKDGLFVSVGPLWSRDNMMLEPQERT
jgi:hypothetical protein